VDLFIIENISERNVSSHLSTVNSILWLSAIEITGYHGNITQNGFCNKTKTRLKRLNNVLVIFTRNVERLLDSLRPPLRKEETRKPPNKFLLIYPIAYLIFLIKCVDK
jgi:hypothetical protein